MPGVNKTSPKYIEARDSLPEELRSVFIQLVEEYAFHSTILHGQGFVSYKILADLVRNGWRPSGRPSQQLNRHSD